MKSGRTSCLRAIFFLTVIATLAAAGQDQTGARTRWHPGPVGRARFGGHKGTPDAGIRRSQHLHSLPLWIAARSEEHRCSKLQHLARDSKIPQQVTISSFDEVYNYVVSRAKPMA